MADQNVEREDAVTTPVKDENKEIKPAIERAADSLGTEVVTDLHGGPTRPGLGEPRPDLHITQPGEDAAEREALAGYNATVDGIRRSVGSKK